MKTESHAKIKSLALGALLVSLALIFSYVEVLLPISMGIPGIKLGLANIVVLIALCRMSTGGAFCISVLRILISALLFGNAYSLLYSAAGGVLSFIIMTLLMRCGLFSVVGVSMAGGAAHNAGQLIAAGIVLGSAKVAYYFPVLLISGMVTGIVNGFIAAAVLRNIKNGALR